MFRGLEVTVASAVWWWYGPQARRHSFYFFFFTFSVFIFLNPFLMIRLLHQTGILTWRGGQPWSWRWFPCPLHNGQVDPYDCFKRKQLERIIFVSRGLRPRNPLSGGNVYQRLHRSGSHSSRSGDHRCDTAMCCIAFSRSGKGTIHIIAAGLVSELQTGNSSNILQKWSCEVWSWTWIVSVSLMMPRLESQWVSCWAKRTTATLRSGDTVTNDRIERCCYC